MFYIDIEIVECEDSSELRKLQKEIKQLKCQVKKVCHSYNVICECKTMRYLVYSLASQTGTEGKKDK